MENYQNGNPGDTGGYQGGEVDNRKRVAAGTIAGNPARKRWKGMKIILNLAEALSKKSTDN